MAQTTQPSTEKNDFTDENEAVTTPLNLPQPGTRRLLIWDAPNIDMAVTQIIGRKPGPSDRPDMRTLGRWLAERAAPGDDVEACIFVNVPPHLTNGIQGWIMFLTGEGYRVFAKPKVDDSDIDDDMLAFIAGRRDEGLLVEVLVASNDSRNFLEPLEETAAGGVAVSVLGFAECAGALSTSSTVAFVDLESIPGLFQEPLPRVDVRSLPREGRWFEPRGRLGGDTLAALAS